MDALISRRRRTLMLGALGATALVACQRPDAVKNGTRVHLTGETMGSTYNVKFDRAGQPVERVADAVGAALQAVDESMSRFRPASELNKLNDAAAGVPVPLSPELFAVLTAAQEVSQWSAGAFDVTVAPAVEAWGFGVSKRRRVPAIEQIALQREKVGWQALQLDAVHRTAIKRRGGMQADLGGIAKGYGVDAVALALEGLGIREYMVEVGGEVRTSGVNAAGEPWQIGIEQPDAMPQRARHVVPLSGRSMATSGDYRIYFEQDGRRFSHEIDPVTGEPVAHRLCSVTVISNDCLHADALATALIVLGSERGYQLAERSAIAAQFIERIAPGRYVDRMTTSFAALGARRV